MGSEAGLAAGRGGGDKAVTNGERCEFLLKGRDKEYREMLAALGDRDWNRAIRKAQETVELSLKAVLKYSNIEFPKEHDVGKHFGLLLRNRGISIEPDAELNLKRISADLAKKRAPAYYGEEFYDEQEARKAAEDAAFVLKLTADILSKLGGRGSGNV